MLLYPLADEVLRWVIHAVCKTGGRRGQTMFYVICNRVYVLYLFYAIVTCRIASGPPRARAPALGATRRDPTPRSQI